MATIIQQPVDTNSAYVPNVWTVDTLGGADRFVLRVLIGGSPVATIKQPANPAGVAHFDVSKILQSYLQPTFVELTQFAADTPGAYLSYQVEIGTETGNVVTIDDTSGTKHVINAYDNWRVLNSDFSDFIPEPVPLLCEVGSNVNASYPRTYRFLTNYPETTYKVRQDEYKTLSFFAKVNTNGINYGPNEAPFFVVFTYYLGAVQVVQAAFTLAQARGSSLRTDCQDMTVSFSDDNAITTIGVGPQNQLDAGISGTWDNYTVQVYSYNHCDETPITNCSSITEMLLKTYGLIYQAKFEIVDECTPFVPVTLSFLNQYGVKDYVTLDRRNTKTVNTARNNYTKMNGTWSASSFTIDQQGRGDTVFSSYADTEMTLQSNWMSDETSAWLQELFISPSVMAYVDGAWEPVVITSNTYEEKSYARNRMFQHEISIKFANNQKIQRG